MTKTTAREKLGFLPLLAGNLLVLALLSVAVCVTFGSSEPLWLLQAPYFTTGAVVVLVLMPLEMWFLRWVHPRDQGPIIEGLQIAALSVPLGIPAALLIYVASALGARSDHDASLAGLWGYAFIGGFGIAIGLFICALAGRLLAELFGRFRPLTYVMLAAVLVEVTLAVVYVVTRLA